MYMFMSWFSCWPNWIVLGQLTHVGPMANSIYSNGKGMTWNKSKYIHLYIYRCVLRIYMIIYHDV